MSTTLSVVVPVYREEKNILPFLERTRPVLESLGVTWEIIFCLDPSPDRTADIIVGECICDDRIKLIEFSRRFGQPAATIAGILTCKGEACVVIDVDLQDPPEIIVDLYAKMTEGFDVVYAKRRSRKGETFVKLIISSIGYHVIKTIADVSIPRDTGDFRIINRTIIEHLRGLKEAHCFLRGLVAFIGYRQTSVEYDRDQRAYGIGNYNRYLGSLKIGLNGLVSFSNTLLSLSTLFGLGISLISFLIALFIIISKLFTNTPYPLGIPATITVVLFLGGVQLISIGVLGEYIGRIYDEVKQRPKYIISRTINIHSENNEHYKHNH